MNVLSLFDGISCGQVALNRAGISYDKYFASEIDQDAISVTQHNYPNTIQLGDVTKIDLSKLPIIDLLIGGSPCQGFSFAGKQLNFNDPRSKLFFDYVRIKNQLNPKYFLLENVNMKKEWRDLISSHLGVNPIRINSNKVSACNRDRWYWTNIPYVDISEVDITFDTINSGESRYWLPNDKIERMKNWKSQQKPINNATLIGSHSKLPCLTARGYNQYHSGCILISDGEKFRYLTNSEAELAMTLPLGYTSILCDRARSKAIGNGWTVDVVSHIFKNIGK